MPQIVSDIFMKRKWFSDKTTVGELYMPNGWSCFTLEDTVRAGADRILQPGEKKQGITAIPEGRYQIIINESVRFKRQLPLLLEVPLFTGVRIHPGNTADNTDGCILVGMDYTPGNDLIGRSVAAFNAFFPKLQALLAEGPTFITVEGGR